MNKPISHSRIRLAVSLLLLSSLSLASLGAQAGPANKPQSAAGPLPAAALSAFPIPLSAEQAKTLLATGELTQFGKDKVQAALCPVPEARPAIEQALASVKPSIAIESLVVLPMPENLQGRADRDLVLFNLLHGFQTMEGIQYWSASRNTMRVFFLKSHLVKSQSDRTILEDPRFSALEARTEHFLEQEDSSFGKNLYRISIQNLGNGGLVLNMLNLDQVWYGVAPVLGPRSMDMHILVQASADGKWLYLYGNSGINAARVLGLDERAQTSYYNRIIALFNWFAKALAGIPPA